MRRIGILSAAVVTVALSACGTSPQSTAPEALGPQFVEGEVLVQLSGGLTAQSLSSLEATYGIQAVERVAVTGGAPLYLTRITDGASVQSKIDTLSASGSVRFAEPNWIYTHNATSNDPYYTNGSLWGMYGDATSPANQFGSQAGEAWAAGYTGSNSIYIGVIDEGIDLNHEDLKPNIGPNPLEGATADGIDNDKNGYVDDIYGWDFDGNDNTIYDGKGPRDTSTDAHGTHVAGTIGGVGGNGKGVAGVNWNVKMLSGKFLGKYGGTTANAIKAVDYFTGLKAGGVNIVATSNSWGGGGFSQGLLDAINRGGNAGILFIAAAGNGGSDGVGDDNDTTENYPSNYQCTANATFDCVIAVAAIQSDGTLAGFSNYGATTVDLGAPGRGVYSTTPKNTYKAYSGTSMATPHVSGAAALYASVKPKASTETDVAFGARVKAAVLDSAAPTASLNGKTVTNGRLDANGALSK